MRMELTALSSNELLTTLDTAWTAGNRALAQMLAYLGEVERRRLHEEMSCSSMFVFLERRFGLTGGSAFRRLTAARLVRRSPTILGRVERGDIHLEALCALRDVLTEANVEDLMAATARKTLREIEQVLACRFPKPDVEPSIRKLPEKPQVSGPREERTVGLFASATTPAQVPPMQTPPPVAVQPFVAATPTPPVPVSATRSARPRMEQLSEARHKVQLTVSSETRAKVERARDLMKHRNPTGDLEVIFDRAMDALVEKLEKERLGKTDRPQAKPRPCKPDHVATATRREVFERDGEQCTFVDAEGTRCSETGMLELDHVDPKARGGSSGAENLRVRCRAHNQMYAREVYGADHIETAIRFRQRASGSG